ncbi:MAG: U32 family peptidase [Clostridia bacterium]|nr:U32 family peptidase [Clostridia bacterium]
MKKSEILAPAGSFDAFIAAVRSGADAVYLGAQSLNARRGAANFTDDQLKEASLIAKEHGIRIYLTVNTLVRDNETDLLTNVVSTACDIGADALIIQDIGVASLVRKMSDIPIHASTQMSVHTVSGAKKLQQLGFSRIVVPRELSQKELYDICNSVDVEIEMFVHGALCMCVSGQCLMSALFGSRSGNRGLCAQPCRLPFSVKGGTGHDLSLKDLSLLPYLSELQTTGVASFKIEGRMKRPEYVAAAVTACKSALSGDSDSDIFDKLRRVFSRSGFTDGYYTENRGRNMFGTRLYEDVTAAAPVLSELRRLYESEKPLYRVDFSFACKEGESVSLTASDGTNTVTVTADPASKAQKKAIDEETVKNQLSKCGGTLYYCGNINCTIDDGLFLPASTLNELRRSAIEKLTEHKRQFKRNRFVPVSQNHTPHKAEKAEIYVRFADENQIPDELDVSKVILPIRSDDNTFKKYNAAAELPRMMFGRENAVAKRLEELKNSGVTEAVFGTLDGLAVIQKVGLSPIAGFGSNVFNTSALSELQKMNVKEALLSCELTLKESARLGGEIRRGVFAYGRIPLMITRNCPVKNGTDCKSCRQNGSLTDRKGMEFPVDCRSGCAEILNSVPTYLGDKKEDIKNIDFLLLYFTKETKQECEHIISLFKKGLPFDGDFTRGLALRGVE